MSALQENLSGLYLNYDDNTGYGIHYDNDQNDSYIGALYSFDISEEADGSLTKIAENVADIQFADRGRVYYRKDVRNTDVGTLYYKDRLLAESVNKVVGRFPDTS